MGLKKDLKRMSAAIKAKFTGGSSGKRPKGFNMFHFWMVVFSGFLIGYVFYYFCLRKRPKLPTLPTLPKFPTLPISY
jgi:hypothetical protein